MKWTWITSGKERYCVNMHHVKHVQKLTEGARIHFMDGSSILAKEPAGSILAAQEVITARLPHPGD